MKKNQQQFPIFDDSEELFKLAFENANIGMCLVSLDGKLFRVNSQMSKIFGYSKQELEQMSVNDIANPSYANVSPTFINKAASGEIDHTTFEKEYIHKNGNIVYGQVSSSIVRDSNGKPAYFISHVIDITERKQLEEQMRQLAFYDPLTNLPNRRLLNERLDQALVICKRNDTYGALMFLDLDNLKMLNDKQGHEFGDALLIQVSRRLKKCIREIDTIARLGGDEFVVMLNDLSVQRFEATQKTMAVAEKIRSILSEPYLLSVIQDDGSEVNSVYQSSVSIGIVIFNHEYRNLADILRWADIAMYKAKEAGRNAIRLYEIH